MRDYLAESDELDRMLRERLLPWTEPDPMQGPMPPTALEQLDADFEPLRVEFRRLGDKYIAPIVWAMVRGLNWLSRKLS